MEPLADPLIHFIWEKEQELKKLKKEIKKLKKRKKEIKSELKTLKKIEDQYKLK